MSMIAAVRIRAAEIAEKIAKMEEMGVVVDPIEPLEMIQREFPFQDQVEVGQALASEIKELARQQEQHASEIERFVEERKNNDSATN